MLPDRVRFKGQVFTTDQGPTQDGSLYDITPEGRLRHAVTETVRLPEEEWPTSPGDPWHGLVGTTTEAIIGWSPIDWTGTLTMTAEDTGRPVAISVKRGQIVEATQ